MNAAETDRACEKDPAAVTTSPLLLNAKQNIAKFEDWNTRTILVSSSQ